MPLFDKEARRAKKEARQLARTVAKYEAELPAWQEEMDKAEELLALAQEFDGLEPDEAETPLVAKRGELVFLHIPGGHLIEPRRLPGKWQGGHRGVSVRIAKGVSYRVGGSRGRYQQGAETLQSIDQGDVVVPNKRVVFLGNKQSREWAYTKMMGLQHDNDIGTTYVQVSNRQKVSGFGYGPGVAQDVQFRLALAMAHYDEDLDDLVTDLEKQLADLRARRPSDPRTSPPPPPAL